METAVHPPVGSVVIGTELEETVGAACALPVPGRAVLAVARSSRDPVSLVPAGGPDRPPAPWSPVLWAPDLTSPDAVARMVRAVVQRLRPEHPQCRVLAPVVVRLAELTPSDLAAGGVLTPAWGLARRLGAEPVVVLGDLVRVSGSVFVRDGASLAPVDRSEWAAAVASRVRGAVADLLADHPAFADADPVHAARLVSAPLPLVAAVMRGMREEASE